MMQARYEPQALNFALAASAAMTSLAMFHLTFGTAFFRALTARGPVTPDVAEAEPKAKAKPKSAPAAKKAPEPVAEVAEPADEVAAEVTEPVAEAAPEIAKPVAEEPAQPAAEEPKAAEPAAAAEPEAPKVAEATQTDDLTKIKGLGPKMQTELNGLGIHSFRQIAGWTPEDVAWYDTNLGGIRGSVTRGGWVDQAKELAEGGSA